MFPTSLVCTPICPIMSTDFGRKYMNDFIGLLGFGPIREGGGRWVHSLSLSTTHLSRTEPKPPKRQIISLRYANIHTPSLFGQIGQIGQNSFASAPPEPPGRIMYRLPVRGAIRSCCRAGC